MFLITVIITVSCIMLLICVIILLWLVGCMSILYVMHNAFNVCYYLTVACRLYVMHNAFNVCDSYFGLYAVCLFYMSIFKCDA